MKKYEISVLSMTTICHVEFEEDIEDVISE